MILVSLKVRFPSGVLFCLEVIFEEGFSSAFNHRDLTKAPRRGETSREMSLCSCMGPKNLPQNHCLPGEGAEKKTLKFILLRTACQGKVPPESTGSGEKGGGFVGSQRRTIYKQSGSPEGAGKGGPLWGFPDSKLYRYTAQVPLGSRNPVSP